MAEAEDGWRRRRSVRLETPDGYSFTAEAAIAIAQRVMRGDFLAGFQTPAKVYGADFVLGFKGTRRQELRRPFLKMQPMVLVRRQTSTYFQRRFISRRGGQLS